MQRRKSHQKKQWRVIKQYRLWNELEQALKIIELNALKRQIATSKWHQKGDPQVHQEEANGQEAKQATYMNKIVRQNVGVKVRQKR